MVDPPVTIKLENSELLVVPAKHFCHIFSHEVHRICSCIGTRPDAIAVELGPGTCAAALSWLKELGIGSSSAETLPVMLALMKRNRMIRPSLKEKVLRLQTETGKDLSELPPETLHYELGYSSHSVLFMSPGDSIIEALRCALELDIPAYGVDLEETALGIHQPIVMRDPKSASGSISAFVAENLGYADTSRDEEIDDRREFAMAARLKALLMQHKRVVFTCGMAHWLRIQRLLFDKTVRPSPIEDSQIKTAPEYRRVVVHPVIAAQHMDPFPPLVHAYEKSRSPVGLSRKSAKTRRPINSDAIYRSCLKSACRKYFRPRTSLSTESERSHDLGMLSSFEQYLRNLCRLNHCTVPDLGFIAQAAEQMMSHNFAQVLIEKFMTYPWASPKDYPSCGLLQPPKDSEQGHGDAVLVDDGSIIERRLFIRSVPHRARSRRAPKISFKWHQSTSFKWLPSSYTWRPWEYLITSMSYRAISSGTARSAKMEPVVFEGSLLDGIDVKGTIRAWSRGSESIYVRDTLYEPIPDVVSPIEGFPVVWILNPGKHANSDWKVLHEPSSFMEPHVRDTASFIELKSTRGGNMVALLAYGKSTKGARHSRKGEQYHVEHYHGIAVFQPICWTNRQYARWAEMTKFKRNPFCHETSLSRTGELRNSYASEYGLKIQAHEWETALMLMALPYARNLLTIVVPEGYRISNLVLKKARKNGVRVAVTSLKSFENEEITRLALCPLVPVISVEPEIRYSRSIEKAIGEPQTKNRDLVPVEWFNFGGRK